KGEDQTNSVAGANIRTITAPQRLSISSDSSHHSGSNVAEAEVDFVLLKKHDSASGGFSDVSGSEFLIGGIRTVVDLDSDLQKVYVPQWSVTNGSRLDDGRVCHEMLDEFAPPKFFASIRGMEHGQLFTEFNVGAARQIYLSVEVRMHAEYNIKEKGRLRYVVDEQTKLLKVRDGEIKNLKAQLLLKEAEAAEAIRLRAEAFKFEAIEKSLEDEVREQEAADLDAMGTFIKSQNDNLVDQVHKLETSSAGLLEKVTVYEDCMSQLEKFQDERIEVVYEKFNKLHADFVEMALHLEEKFYPHLLTTIVDRRWLLTYGMKLAMVKCLNSPEYLSALGAAISKAIEKGIDYISALHDLQSVNFSFLADLKSNKDACLETLMDILLLDETLEERLALSLSLDVSHSRVQRIKKNIANNKPTLRDVFVPLAEPLSIVALEGTGGTFGTAPDTTTTLSTTYMSASSIPPISTDDYMVVHADSQEGTGTDGQIGAGADVN
ncbi:hypothetical protein Tco_1025163, partial [Tanacetum coccineum]